MHPRREPVWHVEFAVLVAIMLQFSLASQLSVLPRGIIALLELLLLFGLHFAYANARDEQHRGRHTLGLILTSMITIANVSSLWLVCYYLILGARHVSGEQLLLSALAIYFTNIIIFGLWYWQLDGGGPGGRGTHRPPVDFLFPQMSTPAHITEQPHWRPSFIDYLFVSVTNGTAFSPTDALPLTHRAKVLMSIQALVSLLTVALVAARAVNILS